MRDEIDDILRSRLHDVDIHEGLPSWERIEESISLIEDEKNKKKIIYLFRSIWGYAAVGLILLGIGIGGSWIFNNNRTNNISTNVIISSSEKELEDPTSPVLEENVQITEFKTDGLLSEILAIEKSNTIIAIEDETNIIPVYQVDYHDESIVLVSGDKIFKQIVNNENIIFPANLPPINPLNILQTDLKEEKYYYDIESYMAEFNAIYNDLDDKNSFKWGSGLFLDFLAFHFIPPSLEGYSQKLITANDYYGKPTINDKIVLLLNNDLINRYRETIFDIMVDYPYQILTHNFPFSLSLAANRDFSKNLGLESGVVYTFMESNSGLKAKNSIYYNQKLHYLGIPISIYYSLLQNSSNWDIDLRGGIVAEKSISSVGTTTVFENYRVLESSINKSNPKEIMLSANFGLGFGYKIFNDFGIYLEPSMAYYFYTKGQPLSYKTDRPFSFNLKAGIRFDF